MSSRRRSEKDGMLRATSVGFVPRRMTKLPGGGWLYEAIELLEVSLVDVPANPSCVLRTSRWQRIRAWLGRVWRRVRGRS